MTTNNDNTPKDYYKWFLLLFLWVAFFLHQGTRQIYNAILPQIQDAFGVDSTKMGIVATIFTLTYGICAPLSGFASDFLKRKYMVIVGLGVFCSGIFISGWVSSIGLMIVFYGLLNGAGQAFYYPAACSLLGQLHEKTRATALAIHQTALYAGIVICSCVSGMFADIPSVGSLDGWRIPFILFGGIGILWAAMLVFLMRDTKPIHQTNSAAAAEKASFKDAFLVMFRKPAAISLALGFGMMIYVDCGFKTWMPAFLQEHFKMDAAVAATNAVVWHYAGAFFGVMFGGRITDKLAKTRKTIRFEANIVGLLCGAPFIYLMANTPSQTLCCVEMAAFGLCRGVYDSNLFASLFDVVAPRYRASASGLMLCFAFIIGSSAPAVLGWIRDEFGMNYGIASLSVFYLAGGLIILVGRNLFFKRDYEHV